MQQVQCTRSFTSAGHQLKLYVTRSLPVLLPYMHCPVTLHALDCRGCVGHLLDVIISYSRLEEQRMTLRSLKESWLDVRV